MKKTALACFAIILLWSGCSKSNDDDVTIHCDNLVNESIPAGDPGRVFVANAFTPNGDGINDHFKVFATGIASINIRVYDGNSNIIYQSSQTATGWNHGAFSANSRTYYYRVEAVTNNNTKIGLCGEVHALNCYPRNTPSNTFFFEDQLTPLGFTGVTSEPISACN